MPRPAARPPMPGWESDRTTQRSRRARAPARRLVELKARLEAPSATVRRLVAAGAVRHPTLSQRDVYFRVPRGRLKLRLQRPGRDQPVYYERADVARAKTSRVVLAVLPPDHGLEAVLRRALGVVGEVRKRRQVFDWAGTRVHVDRVRSLGAFLEFEHRVGPGASPARLRRLLDGQLRGLGVPAGARLAGSYIDLGGGGAPDRRAARRRRAQAI